MISVILEDRDMWRLPAERCVFCSSKTRRWHRQSNTPVCVECAAHYSEADLVGRMADHPDPLPLLPGRSSSLLHG